MKNTALFKGGAGPKKNTHGRGQSRESRDENEFDIDNNTDAIYLDQEHMQGLDVRFET